MKKIKAQPYLLERCTRVLALLPFLAVSATALAQQGSQGNTTIFSGAQMTFFGNHDFVSGGGGTQPGIIGTVRMAPAGVLNFGTAANTHTGADDANHVDGYVRKVGATSFIFPVGDNGQYGPFAASGDGTTGAYYHVDPTSAVTSNLGGGNYGVLPAGGPFPSASMTAGLNAVSTVEYWDIDGANATPITLTWDAGSNVATLTNNFLSRLTIVGWNGTAWETIASAADATSVLGGASTLSAGSITTAVPMVPNTYTVYTLGGATTPLPVSLISFTATKSKGAALLRWETASMKDVGRFEIEHGTTGKDWSYIGRVQVQRDAPQNARYSFEHKTPVAGVNFYRLKMVDFNGTYSYSGVRSLSFDGRSGTTVYPNPAIDHVFIRADDPEAIKGVSLTDLSGRELIPFAPLGNGEVNIRSLTAGAYLLNIYHHNGDVEHYRIIRSDR